MESHRVNRIISGRSLPLQCGFRPNRSTTDMMFVVRRLQEIGRKAGVLFVFLGFEAIAAFRSVALSLL